MITLLTPSNLKCSLFLSYSLARNMGISQIFSVAIEQCGDDDKAIKNSDKSLNDC